MIKYKDKKVYYKKDVIDLHSKSKWGELGYIIK